MLELVSEGLRNREIADRLYLSEKTVHHHVSAILRKLEVPTRGQAAAEAARLGIGKDRQTSRCGGPAGARSVACRHEPPTEEAP